MNTYLNLFKTKAEADAAVYDENNTPNVSYCEEDNSVKYTEKIVPPPAWMDMVDLGLPSGILWAKANLGANAPEKHGDYYMWGSVTPNTNDVCDWAHTPYQTNASATSYSAAKWTKYLGSTSSSYKDPSATDEDVLKTVLDPEDDAVYVATSGAMRMPTIGNFNELLRYTTSEWTTINGVIGRKFTSNSDPSKYIFIPASGGRRNSDTSGSVGYVRSSTLNRDYPYRTNILLFRESYCDTGVSEGERNIGYVVRGVCSKN